MASSDAVRRQLRRMGALLDADPVPSEVWSSDDGVLYHYTVPESWPLLRRVSKAVASSMSGVRMKRKIRLNRAYWDNLAGSAEEKRDVIMHALRRATSTGVIVSLELPGFMIMPNLAFYTPGIYPDILAAITPALLHLDLSGNHFGHMGIRALVPNLSTCTALTHLDLSNTQLHQNGMLEIGSVLPRLTALAHLNLSCNFPMAPPAFIAMYQDVLPRCRAMTHLDLSANSISDQGLADLVSALCECPALLELNLSGNSIRGLATASFVRVLAHWSLLRRLDVRWCIQHVDQGLTQQIRAAWLAGVNTGTMTDVNAEPRALLL